MPATKSETRSKVDEIVSKPYRLILCNDDYNTFAWVITCLMKICNHDEEQANQCAHIVHFSGKCEVKRGDKDMLTIMKEKLQNAGLSVIMEKTF